MLALLVPLLINFQDTPDESVLNQGHRSFVSQFSDSGARADAEWRYAMALGKRNEALIQSSAARAQLEELRLLVANITKGACRVADYVHPEDVRFLYNRKANTLANLVIEGFITAKPLGSSLQQVDIWASYRKGRSFHEQNKSKIDDFNGLGGYTFEQHGHEYDALGRFASQIMMKVSRSPENTKQHAFYLCDRLFRLTMGEDPLGY